MAKKAAKKTDQSAARRGARTRVKVVIMELKGIVGFISTPDIDDATREDIEKTLLTCKDRLESVARAFAKPPKSNSTEGEPKTEATAHA